jgi:hypothetical protein
MNGSPMNFRQASAIIDQMRMILQNQLDQLKRYDAYETRWNVYHTILCIGVWGIFICTLIGITKGWGPW